MELNTKLAYTYREIIKSKDTLDVVIEELGLKINSKKLYENIRIDNIDDTGIINITVSSEDPKTAYEVAKKIPEVLSRQIKLLWNTEGISILESPSKSEEPVSPARILIILLCIIMGIIISLIIIFLYEYIDKRIKYSCKVKSIFKIDIIGSIPYIKKSKDKDSVDEPSYLSLPQIKNYEEIITNIQLFNIDKKIKTIAFISLNEKEGKSVVISDIAILLSKMHKKILVLDFSLLNPVINQKINALNQYGLKDLFFENRNIEECISETNIDNLFVIQLNIPLRKSDEILSSKTVENMIETLRNRYDYILIDTVAISKSSEVMTISSYTDSYIIVAENKKVKCSQLLDIKQELNNKDIKIMGIILNKIRKQIK